MNVFVDTGVLYAAFDVAASRHERGRSALSTVLQSAEYGRPTTSEYVYDETVTLTYRRTGSMAKALEVGERLRPAETTGPQSGLKMLYSSRTLFDDAVAAFERFSDHSLSFTDAMTVAMVDRRDIDAVLSFDDDFDGVVERLDPMTVAER